MDEKAYTELSVHITEVDQRLRSNERTLDNHERMLKSLMDDNKTLIKLTGSVDTIARSLLDVNKKIDVIVDKQDDLSEKVTILENKPAQAVKNRIDGLWDKLVWLVVGGVVVWMLQNMLPAINW